jgi:6-methylsalicylate decarboxylase
MTHHRGEHGQECGLQHQHLGNAPAVPDSISTGTGLTRRAVLGCAALAGAGALLHGLGARALAQPATAPFRIDVHHHLVPPKYLADISAKMHPEPPLVQWTPARSLEDMDAAGIRTSVNSITTPGLWFGNAEESSRIARECNDYSAKLAADYPGRYGIFAALPLPDIDGSLREIEYALDTLKADGIAMFTSYGDKYLGDAAFAPVFAELNRRKAVVYTHPTGPACCRNLVSDVPPPVIEYGTDTTRTIASLVFSGAAARYADVRFIFSHAGGTMPFLAERFINLGAARPNLASRFPNGVLHELQRFIYDTAQSSNPYAMGPLVKLVTPTQIVFGTDYPFRTSIDHVKGLADCGFSAAELRAIERDNAVRLLPRLSA